MYVQSHKSLFFVIERNTDNWFLTLVTAEKKTSLIHDIDVHLHVQNHVKLHHM